MYVSRWPRLIASSEHIHYHDFSHSGDIDQKISYLPPHNPRVYLYKQRNVMILGWDKIQEDGIFDPIPFG